MKDIKSLTIEELEEEIKLLGEPKFRAGQIYDWMHKKLAVSFDDMTNLSKTLKEKLKAEYDMPVLKTVDVRESVDGTKKYLFELPDGNFIECVRMEYKHGISVCISSQVGCRMGCKFCASTLDGLDRNLTAGEMLEEIYALQRNEENRISNIVIMGSGEPLDNYDNVVRFLRLISNEKGLNISQRNITLSTCGLADKIKKLAEEKLQITLALSLHAATDEKRKELMPVAKSYSIKELMEACAFYFEQTGRRITFEYCLVKDSNDSHDDAEKLCVLAAQTGAHVNLIPVNPVAERGLKPPSREYIFAFKNKLEKKRINVTIRREMGSDIDGACGQLRRRHIQGN